MCILTQGHQYKGSRPPATIPQPEKKTASVRELIFNQVAYKSTHTANTAHQSITIDRRCTQKCILASNVCRHDNVGISRHSALVAVDATIWWLSTLPESGTLRGPTTCNVHIGNLFDSIIVVSCLALSHSRDYSMLSQSWGLITDGHCSFKSTSIDDRKIVSLVFSWILLKSIPRNLYVPTLDADDLTAESFYNEQ